MTFSNDYGKDSAEFTVIIEAGTAQDSSNSDNTNDTDTDNSNHDEDNDDYGEDYTEDTSNIEKDRETKYDIDTKTTTDTRYDKGGSGGCNLISSSIFIIFIVLLISLKELPKWKRRH